MQIELSPARRAFLKFTQATVSLEQYVDSDGLALLTANVNRLERFLNGDSGLTSYAILKQVMTDMDKLFVVQDVAKVAWVFLVAYAEMLDVIDAENG